MSSQASHRIVTRFRRSRGATFAGIVLSILIGLAAVAAAPIQTTTVVDQTRIDTRTCPFAITVHLRATLRDLLFFDENGNLVRVHESVGEATTEYTANGNTLTSIGTGNLDLYFNPNGSVTLIPNGINELLVLPGQRPIFLDTGHTEFLRDETGFHLVFRAGPFAYDIPAFCAALA